MKNDHYLEQQLEEILNRVKFPTSTYGDLDTYKVLHKLATTSEWGEAELEHVDFLSKRFDITGKLFLSYLENHKYQ